MTYTEQVHLPAIQERLDIFRAAWNSHRLRTESNRTPNQIWMEGMVANRQQDTTAINNVFSRDPYNDELETMLGRYGVQLTQLEVSQDDLERAVVVTQPQMNLHHRQWQRLKDTLTTITDLKEKYLTCCREMTRFLH